MCEGKRAALSLPVHMHCIFLIRETEMPSNRHKKKQGMIAIYVINLVAHILLDLLFQWLGVEEILFTT